MAAPAAPDAKTLMNWEEAFEHYSIPQVRTLHRQLQNDLAVNREKLRALVGESYRDLLRTAEKIIEMDGSMQKVENNLADASRNCSYRLMEKKARNVKLFQQKVDGRDREKYIFAAEVAILQGCPTEISKLLHRNGSCILAARIFVVSRLVLKALQEKGTAVFPMVISLRDQMTTLRSLLLQQIDHQLRMMNIPTSTIIESMCALALVKTSSPADLLRHFLSMRSNAISTILDPSTLNSESIHDTLKLFHSTLRDTEAIFPKKITEALQLMKSRPLFENPELRNMPGLNFHTNERWLPEDIREFIPWVRHDELERSRMHDSVRTWANRELETLNGSIKQVSAGMGDIESVVQLRRGILDSWRGNRSKLLHVIIGKEEPRRKFRELLNERLVELLGRNANELMKVDERIRELAVQPKDSNPDSTNLWSDALLNMPFSNGAFIFRRNIKAAVSGHDTSIKSVIREYRNWSKLITQSFELVKGIRNSGKQDDFDDDDEFGLGSDDALDGVEDAEMLQKTLCQSLENAYKSIEGDLEKLVSECEQELQADPNGITARSTFLLRSIRHLCLNPPRPPKSDEIIRLGWFGQSLFSRLHSLVSTGFSSQALSLLRRALHRRKWGKECPSVPLWEGVPRPLPTQPSPDIFKFLHELVTVMAKAGIDVWTPATVQRLRKVVRDEVWVIVGAEIGDREIRLPVAADQAQSEEEESGDIPAKLVDTNSEGRKETQAEGDENSTTTETNEPDETKSKKEEKKEPSHPPTITTSWAIQLIYDFSYLLIHAFPHEPAPSDTDKFAELKNRFAVLNDGEFERIEASAEEYWKRTSLLFSLLA